MLIEKTLPRAVTEVNRCHCTNTLKATSHVSMAACTQDVTPLSSQLLCLLSFALNTISSPSPRHCLLQGQTWNMNKLCLDHATDRDVIPLCFFERPFLVSWEQLPPLPTSMSTVCATCLAWCTSRGPAPAKGTSAEIR